MGFFDDLNRIASGDSKDYSDTGDAGKDAVSNHDGGGKYNQGMASRETGSGQKETSSAWHTARDDYEKDEGMGDRHEGHWYKK